MKDINMEAAILQAAEDEFLEKGYGSAKTVAIAKRAGVTHAMVHYYFRTKENLFQMVFEKKIQVIVSLFERKQNLQLPFFDVIREMVSSHFDFLAENPRLMSFVINEVVANTKNRDMVLRLVAPSFRNIVVHLTKLIKRETAKGSIHPIKAEHLMINIAALNVVSFQAVLVLGDFYWDSPKAKNKFLKERKENNIKFIIRGLKK
jgi:AcrR family transcriptional regulator